MPERTSAFGQNVTPVERLAKAAELAPAYAFLASLEAVETPGVTGGMIMP